MPLSRLRKGTQAMKTFATWALIAGTGLMGAVLMTGCGSTPAYSGDERAAQVGRNWALEWQEASDDMDNVLLIRPSSTLTQWDVVHRE
jgi:hypothetical protein